MFFLRNYIFYFNVNQFQAFEETIPILLLAHLNVAQIKDMQESSFFTNSKSKNYTIEMSENRTPEKDNNSHYGKWTRKAEFVDERKLQCIASQNFGELPFT